MIPSIRFGVWTVTWDVGRDSANCATGEEQHQAQNATSNVMNRTLGIFCGYWSSTIANRLLEVASTEANDHRFKKNNSNRILSKLSSFENFSVVE
jgi:hypothetical protein